MFRDKGNKPQEGEPQGDVGRAKVAVWIKRGSMVLVAVLLAVMVVMLGLKTVIVIVVSILLIAMFIVSLVIFLVLLFGNAP